MKVIHWELCKEMKFDQTIKWYIYKTESILEISLVFCDTNRSLDKKKPTLLSGKSNPLGIVQGNEIWPYYQIVYAQNRIRLIEFFSILR